MAGPCCCCCCCCHSVLELPRRGIFRPTLSRTRKPAARPYRQTHTHNLHVSHSPHALLRDFFFLHASVFPFAQFSSSRLPDPRQHFAHPRLVISDSPPPHRALASCSNRTLCPPPRIGRRCCNSKSTAPGQDRHRRHRRHRISPPSMVREHAPRGPSGVCLL